LFCRIFGFINVLELVTQTLGMNYHMQGNHTKAPLLVTASPFIMTQSFSMRAGHTW
jgi:hypothetical protein